MDICQLKRMFAGKIHLHDDRYLTETEIDDLMSSKSDVGHLHDDRYYTESEIDTLLSAISGGVPDSILIADIKAYNVGGGSSIVGWATRDLTDVVVDTGSNVVSLSSNQLVLVNGLYRILHISAPAYKADRHFIRLLSISGTPAIEIYGPAMYCWPTDATVTRAVIVGETFTAYNHTFELQHHCDNAQADVGYGATTNLSGYDSIYSLVHLERLS